jgi:hypothetical protein
MSQFFLVLVLVAATCLSAHAKSELSRWKFCRTIQIPADTPAGLVGLPLGSETVRKCRPDLADIRVVTSDQVEVPIFIRRAVGVERPVGLPVRVFRIAKRPGRWTDIWIDKTAKVVSNSVVIETTSKNFLRRVEIRGSDNARDSFVIRVDGLIADIESDVPLRSLEIRHPLNNFQYVHVRIIDEGRPPLKIRGAKCYPYRDSTGSRVPLEARIIENRSNPNSKTTTIIADLGPHRFPVTSLAVAGSTPRFVSNVTIFGSDSSDLGSWKEIFEGTFFRIQKGSSIKERLNALFSPSYYRYLKVELSGEDEAPIAVDSLDVAGACDTVCFKYVPTRRYRLFYANPQASHSPSLRAPMPSALLSTSGLSSKISLGQEEKVVVPKVKRESERAPEAAHSGFGKVAGVVFVLMGLLLLFGIMLKSRSKRKMDRTRHLIR